MAHKGNLNCRQSVGVTLMIEKTGGGATAAERLFHHTIHNLRGRRILRPAGGWQQPGTRTDTTE